MYRNVLSCVTENSINNNIQLTHTKSLYKNIGVSNNLLVCVDKQIVFLLIL